MNSSSHVLLNEWARFQKCKIGRIASGVCLSWTQVHSEAETKTYSRSLVIMFNVTLLQHWWKKSISSRGQCRGGIGTFFPCLCGSFLGTPICLHFSMLSVLGELACRVYIGRVWVIAVGCVSAPCSGMASSVESWFTPHALSCWDRIWPLVTLNWSKEVNNYLVFINLDSIYVQFISRFNIRSILVFF